MRSGFYTNLHGCALGEYGSRRSGSAGSDVSGRFHYIKVDEYIFNSLSVEAAVGIVCVTIGVNIIPNSIFGVLTGVELCIFVLGVCANESRQTVETNGEVCQLLREVNCPFVGIPCREERIAICCTISKREWDFVV